MRYTLKILACILVLFIGLSMVILAQDSGKAEEEMEELTGPYGISAPIIAGIGGGMTFGLYSINTGDKEIDEFIEVLAGIASLQVSTSLLGGYRLTEDLAVGAEAGYAFSIFSSEDSPPTNYYLRGIGRGQWAVFFAQPHIGFYIINPDIVGFTATSLSTNTAGAVAAFYFDVGTKAGFIFGPVEIYIEVSYMLGQQSHQRVGGGAALVIQ